MTDYRMVARHVRYWRGQVHRWSNVYRFTGTIPAGSYGTAITAIHDLDVGVCWKGLSVPNGGLYEVALYDHATGGVPVAVSTYFDWTIPAGWIQYTSGGWPASSVELESNAEVALQVQWPAGLSRTGKPVIFRKWYHAVPIVAGPGSAAQVSAGQITSLQSFIQGKTAIVGGLGAPMGTGSRLAASTPIVRPFYGNHQMPRGRRKRPLVTSSGRYTGPTISIPGPISLD